mgnify:CR=1 FL=1
MKPPMLLTGIALVLLGAVAAQATSAAATTKPAASTGSLVNSLFMLIFAPSPCYAVKLLECRCGLRSAGADHPRIDAAAGEAPASAAADHERQTELYRA